MSMEQENGQLRLNRTNDSSKVWIECIDNKVEQSDERLINSICMSETREWKQQIHGCDKVTMD